MLRGNAQFELGRWEKAAADYSRPLELRTTANDLEGIATRLACLRVILGDSDGYRRICSALLEKLKDTGNPRTTYLLARVCTFGPGGLADYAPAVQLAKQAVTADAEAPWNIHTLGAVYYRAGQFDKAIHYLRESTDADASWAAQVCNWLMLGQAYSAMGQNGEARPWLDKAKAWFKAKDPKAPGNRLVGCRVFTSTTPSPVNFCGGKSSRFFGGRSSRRRVADKRRGTIAGGHFGSSPSSLPDAAHQLGHAWIKPDALSDELNGCAAFVVANRWIGAQFQQRHCRVGINMFYRNVKRRVSEMILSVEIHPVLDEDANRAPSASVPRTAAWRGVTRPALGS